MRLDEAYIGLLEHIAIWSEWAHEVNRFNYASYDINDTEMPLKYPAAPDDPRDTRDLTNPDIEDIERPVIFPPSIKPGGRLVAIIDAYASEEIKKLLKEWQEAARWTADLGLDVTESKRAKRWKESSVYAVIVSEGKKRYPRQVERLDETLEKIHQQIRLELANIETRQAIADPRHRDTNW